MQKGVAHFHITRGISIIGGRPKFTAHPVVTRSLLPRAVVHGVQLRMTQIEGGCRVVKISSRGHNRHVLGLSCSNSFLDSNLSKE
jgi:hypothetical protein